MCVCVCVCVCESLVRESCHTPSRSPERRSLWSKKESGWFEGYHPILSLRQALNLIGTKALVRMSAFCCSVEQWTMLILSML